MPVNTYRFRADVHGHQYWSGEEGHCALPACAAAEVAVPRFGEVTITVQYRNGEVLPGLPVYAFDGLTYSGISGSSDETGQVKLWLPEGNYHFRADQYDLPFWSGADNHCEVPGCQEAVISTYAYGNDPRQEQEIVYTYDALNRLTGAEYSSGIYFHYTYDGAGNRLSQEVGLDGEPVVTTYAYDDANRLSQVGEQIYTWDANGNLLDDGQRQYSFDAANRLTGLVEEDAAYSYAYNGLGDRVSQSVNEAVENYTLDLNAGLTQVLSDGTNTYLYGQGRVAQETGEAVGYFLPDALGSVRTVLEGNEVLLAKDYTPYGKVLASSGAGTSAYGFAGEWTDESGMQYLRARYYAPSVGRFINRDKWGGYLMKPLSLNKWAYVESDPINKIDPKGSFSSNPIHAMIQAHFSETFGIGHVIQSEFYVQGGSKQGLHFSNSIENDLIQSGTPTGNAGYIDIVDLSTGEAYEIKNEKEFTLGIGEIAWYISTYNANPRPNGPYQLTLGKNYRWESEGWEVIGTNPVYPGQVILAHMKTAGVITYVGHRKDLIPKSIPEYFWEWNREKKLVEKRKTSTIPNLTPSPVPSLSEIPNLCLNTIIIIVLVATPFPDDVLIPIFGKEVFVD